MSFGECDNETKGREKRRGTEREWERYRERGIVYIYNDKIIMW